MYRPGVENVVEPETVVPTHAPDAHDIPAAQAWPQLPQLAASLAVATSHPSPAAPLQSARPASQVNPQVLAAHRGLAPGGVGQARPQPPQLLTSVATLASHPSPEARLQSPRPAAHVKPQAPPAHVAAAAPDGTGQLAGVYPRPSGLHDCVAVGDAQVVLPGVQTQPVQRPPAHDEPAAQAIVRVARPSSLHTLTALGAAQVELPGVQTHGRQLPAAQPCIAPQGLGVNPRPSGSHTRAVVASAQSVAPGTHTRV